MASEKIKNLKIVKTETDQNSKTTWAPNIILKHHEEPNGDLSESGSKHKSRGDSRKGRRNRKVANPTGIIVSPSEAILHNYASNNKGSSSITGSGGAFIINSNT